MKIGLIGSIDFGTHTGARTRATRIYSLLSNHHDVTFLNVNTFNESPIPKEIAGRDLAIRPNRLPHTGRELIAGYRAVTIAVKYDFDLVWAYNSFQHTPLIGYATAQHLNVPLVVGVNDHRHGKGLKGRLVNRYARSFILNRADVLVLESNTLQRNFDEYDITPNQSVVVPTSIDTEEYYLPDEPLADNPVIFYVGRDKDIHLLLDAAATVHEELPKMTVRIAGVDGDVYPKYAEKEYIEFLGFVAEEDLPREIARAWVCTVPYQDSNTAGRPVKILEYMSAQKCIVATDLPFNTQMLSDDDNALITKAKPRAFADGLLLGITNHALRDRLAMQAREDVAAYSLSAMEEKLQRAVQLATQ